MVQELIIAQNTTVVLDNKPTPELAGAMEYIKISKLEDLVSQGIIRSEENLTQLLNAAKTATASALSTVSTFNPAVFVPRTSRVDLRRFASFRVAAGEIGDRYESGLFWRIVRKVEPRSVVGLTVSADLSRLIQIKPIIIFKLRDITIEQNGMLRIGATIDSLLCNDLLIKRGGRVVVDGSGVTIRAHSVKGEH